ncbi:MAG TPA: 1-deoxy-D-xylulose-5-phosphate synthase [Acidimicrobiales bacterium]|nr:1-deoxy-D-xylulose-5-phosphate synthase [Acidimicrobiales bacterium]
MAALRADAEVAAHWADSRDVPVARRHDPSGPEVVKGIEKRLERLSPQALRRMDLAELARLADAIRAFLVDAVSATGGHLGPNLGVVELTLALHRVFDSPVDRIVWDTGHQAYVHKLVTGRAAGFARLKRSGGLSGYPNRAESAHDLVENSHASTALSYAFGLSRAAGLRGGGRVVAVVGDGALTGGLAYEALSNIGAAHAPVIVVLNDNGRSYAPTVSPLADGGFLGGAGCFFESLGLRYEGPVDGHDLAAVEAALRRAAACGGPVVVHARTRKGRGYPPAEQDGEKCLHDVPPFDPATGRARSPKPPSLDYTATFGAALLEEAARRPELVAVTAAMGGPTGLLGFRDRYPDRFFDVGIAEQHAVTAAAGMAMGGLRPVVAIYSTFLNRAWDQLLFDVGLHRLPVVLCVDRAGVTGEDGPSHHGVYDLALLTKVPGMTVLAPSSCEDLAAMVHQALEITDGPVAIRWPKTPAPGPGSAGNGLSARRLREGRRVCLLGVGKLAGACEEAAALLEARGVEPTVWDVRVAAPLDPAMLADARRHDVVVTAEDGIVEGGVGRAVAAALGRPGAARSPVVVCAGLPTAYLPHGSASEILASLGLDGPGLCQKALGALGALGVRPAVGARADRRRGAGRGRSGSPAPGSPAPIG